MHASSLCYVLRRGILTRNHSTCVYTRNHSHDTCRIRRHTYSRCRREHSKSHTRSAAHTLCGTHALRQCVACRGSVHTLSSRQVHGRSRSISLSAQHAHSACAPTASNHGVEHGNLRHTRSAAMRRVSRQRAQTLKLSSRQVHGRSRSISLSPQHAHSACAPTASNHGFEHGNPLTGVDRSFSVAFEQRRNRGRRGGNAMLLANGTRDSQLVLRGWRTGPATPALRRRCQRTRPRRPNRVLRRRKGPIDEERGRSLDFLLFTG